MWELRTELGPSPRAASALNCWTVISLSQGFLLTSAIPQLGCTLPFLLPFLPFSPFLERSHCIVQGWSAALSSAFTSQVLDVQICVTTPCMCGMYVRSHYTWYHTLYIVALLVRISLPPESPVYSFAQPSQDVYQVCHAGTARLIDTCPTHTLWVWWWMSVNLWLQKFRKCALLSLWTSA